MSRPDIQPAASSEGKRIPVQVRVLRFAAPMDAIGLSVASSCSSTRTDNRSKHVVTYLPWLRHFRLEFDAGDGRPQVSMVHETQVKSWDPAPE